MNIPPNQLEGYDVKDDCHHHKAKTVQPVSVVGGAEGALLQDLQTAFDAGMILINRAV